MVCALTRHPIDFHRLRWLMAAPSTVQYQIPSSRNGWNKKQKQEKSSQWCASSYRAFLNWRIKITKNSTHYLASNESLHTKKEKRKIQRSSYHRTNQTEKVYLLRFHSPHAYWMLNHVWYRWQTLVGIPGRVSTPRQVHSNGYISNHNKWAPTNKSKTKAFYWNYNGMNIQITKSVIQILYICVLCIVYINCVHVPMETGMAALIRVTVDVRASVRACAFRRCNVYLNERMTET